MIEICAVGGYDEVGKNMTAIRIDNKVIILDMGIHLEKYILYTEDEDVHDMTAKELIAAGAIPDDSIIDDWKGMVKAIIPTHAHLDHVGALPFISNKYNAPIVCTPFTKEVIDAITRDDNITLKNKVNIVHSNSYFKIGDIKIEFINMTHSTPQTALVAIHTKYGVILYANDFKFDHFPTLGKKPNFERLSSLKNVICLICDSTKAELCIKTPSESVAKQMLKDVLLGVESKGKAIIVTTFSSHLARLKSIIEYGQKINRKVVFLGRSLAKYVQAGEKAGIINFSKDVEIVGYSSKVGKRLRKLEKNKERYLLVVTGHQGEPKSVLSKIARGEFKFNLGHDDNVIFSCTVIPTPINVENRKKLESELTSKHVRIFKDIHVSGHAAKEDIRDLINMVKPKHIIPAHGTMSMASHMAELAVEMGYKAGQTVHIMHNGKRLIL